jgi:hypothetical protein
MTVEELCELLVKMGGTEYPNRDAPLRRNFYMQRLKGVPECACNDRAPAVHVRVYEDWGLPITHEVMHQGGVEFLITGEAPTGRWLSATIYSVRRDEVEGIFPTIEAAAAAVWTAFANTMSPPDKGVEGCAST